jgi:hypothetical protein
LESPQQKLSEVKADESVQEEIVAVKNSLETGQLSKLLIEVRTLLSICLYAIKVLFRSSNGKLLI